MIKIEPPPPEKKITFIHLSDLHMSSNNKFDRGVVIDALWRDIKKYRDGGLSPDFIAFSGDIANAGLTEEYDLAAAEFFDPLLDLTEVSKDRLFIVPGNHDCNWSVTNRLKNPLPSITSENDITQLIEKADARSTYLLPLANYTTWKELYLSSFESSSTSSSSTAYLSESYTLKKDDQVIRIVGLNSVWLSGFNKTSDAVVDDFGRLAIGEVQVESALKNSGVEEIKIAIVHHPFEWLLEPDRSSVQRSIYASFDLVLRGHMHVPNVIQEISLEGELVILPAGSVFSKREWPNSYNIVELDLNTGIGRAFLRKYSDTRREWVKNIDSTGEERDGTVTFSLSRFREPASEKSYRHLIGAYSDDLFAFEREYRHVFTEECVANMAHLGLSEESLLKLVYDEFRGHINYFRFDLEDYPLPLKRNYIAYINKVAHTIQFMGVANCTSDEAQLSAWNDILALYRKATRLVYRTEPDKLFITRGLLGRTEGLHNEIGQRLAKYSADFGSLKDSFRFHLNESARNLKEVTETVNELELGDVSEKTATQTIVMNLEASLQHIHKIIIENPPLGGPGV